MQIVKYGTYGFMSLIISSQLALLPRASAVDTDRAVVDAKKNARAAKRKINKGARSVTGQGSVWKDAKERTSDEVKNAKDDANYSIKKLEKAE